MLNPPGLSGEPKQQVSKYSELSKGEYVKKSGNCYKSDFLIMATVNKSLKGLSLPFYPVGQRPMQK